MEIESEHIISYFMPSPPTSLLLFWTSLTDRRVPSS
ncbi:hypothetical protein ACHAWT_000096 [Skeletonema menzelii]